MVDIIRYQGRPDRIRQELIDAIMKFFNAYLKKIVPPRIGRDPHVDWVYMLALAVLVSAGLVLLGLSAYSAIGDDLDKASSSQVTHKASPLDLVALGKLMKRIDARQAGAAAVRSYAGPADPSR